MTNSQDLFGHLLNSPQPGSLAATVGHALALRPDLRIVFSTSFSLEDQAITHMIAAAALPVHVFTLDTGRHFPETYQTLDATRERYGILPAVFFPQAEAVENLLSKKGAFSFYNSIEDRQECCHLRKVEPLGRALKGAHLWITGIRHAHSPERSTIEPFEIDTAHNVVKYHPLLNWSDEALRAFIKENEIPYNRLQDKGFLSVGCQPCTRAVMPGATMRSGRWWWEDPDKKECGLHVPRQADAGIQP